MTIILLILQVTLIAFILGFILLKRKTTYSSLLLLFCQTLILLVVIYYRLVGQGFTLFFFLYITLIPVVLLVMSKILNKRKKETWLKSLAKTFAFQLDQAFFDLLEINKGVFFFSRKVFKVVVLFFLPRLLNPYKLIINLLILPWVVFVICLLFEISYFNHIYFSAVLLAINVLNYRLILLLFRIIEFSCLENLGFLNNVYFYNTEPTIRGQSLLIFFQNLANFAEPLKEEEERNLDFLLRHYKSFFSGINFSGSYFMVLVLKNKLFAETRFYLSILTFLITLGGYYSISTPAFSFWVSNFYGLFFGLFLYFLVKLFTINQILVEVEVEIFTNQKNLLRFLAFTEENFISFALFTKKQLVVDIFHLFPFDALRPRNIFDFFQPIPVFDIETETSFKSFSLIKRLSLTFGGFIAFFSFFYLEIPEKEAIQFFGKTLSLGYWSISCCYDILLILFTN